MYSDINSEEYREQFADTDHQFIDVREDEEYAEGHIPGAANIPLSEFMARVDEIDEEAVVVLVCNTGVRSSQAALYLASMGYEQIFNLEEGAKGWMRKGYALESG